ncbi:ATP-binding protein [Cytophagaceae bacterium ABcell3]|nr:ATP-binding protein [Cytophagaceae bacterium ABcell3]
MQNSSEKIDDLEKINEEQENYFQSTIIPQLFFDKDFILRKFSPAAMKQFELSDDSIGLHLDDLTNNLKYDYLKGDIQHTMDLRKVVEKELQTSDNRWYRMNVLPFVQKKGNRVNGVIITFIDINNYVLSLKELQRTIHEHEIFIYSVSHDLKSPLNNIAGLVEMLSESLEGKNSQNYRSIIDMLKSSVYQLKGSISELTRISHAQSDSQLDKSKIGFEDILDEVILAINNEVKSSKAQIHKNFQVDEISFSRKNLRSIMYNLLNNAIKFRIPERPLQISFHTQKVDDYILLSVKDNGRGIEKEKQSEIFSQFKRVIKDVEGTGLGLYLVSKIVDGNGGKIEVNSKEGEGAEFLLYLKHE